MTKKDLDRKRKKRNQQLCVEKLQKRTYRFCTTSPKTYPARLGRILLGKHGVKKSTVIEDAYAQHTIRPFPMEHISWQCSGPMNLNICGNTKLIKTWYATMDNRARLRLKRTGFIDFIEHLQTTPHNSAILQCLAEKWWDTTHTFHMDYIGEMTITPTDFSCITKLRVGGKPLRLDHTIYRNRNMIAKYFGRPMLNCFCSTVELDWLYNNYGSHTFESEDDVAVSVCAFILAFLGATLFARSTNRVHLAFLPSLYNLDEINNYDWGGAGLAFLYHQMDDVCRNNTTSLGGLWKTWEVWAESYIPSLHDFGHMKLHMLSPNSPTSSHHGSSDSIRVQLYKIKLTELIFKEVNWNPWGSDDTLPQYAKSSISYTTKRILLYGPDGGAWYLGERVNVQSLHKSCFLVPMTPPTSILVKDQYYTVPHYWVTEGKPAFDFIHPGSELQYETFKQQFQMLTNDHRNKKSNNSPTIEDVIPIPPWTLLLPTPFGRPKVICIPADVEMENLDIPPNVEHVSIVTARKLLRMIACMQVVLIENLTSARQTMNNYAQKIQKPCYQLELKGAIIEEAVSTEQLNANKDDPNNDDIKSDANNGHLY